MVVVQRRDVLLDKAEAKLIYYIMQLIMMQLKAEVKLHKQSVLHS